MKHTFLTIMFFFMISLTVYAEESVNVNLPTTPENAPVIYTSADQIRDVAVFCEKNKFGLKDKNGNVVVKPIYQKMVMTGKSGWIIQYGNRFGLMNSKGEMLIKPKYRYADRILGRYIKLGNDNDFGIYNEFGETIIEPEYSSVELLYGRMFLTKKNFHYGISDFKGNVIIPNICEDIYMPSKTTVKIKYLGEWYEINEVSAEKMDEIRETVAKSEISRDFLSETGAVSGYSVLTISDYIIKVLSSISPAHEETIDDLILAHGVDTVGILKKFTWLPKYPLTFFKKYFTQLRNPYNGPLSDTRNRLINRSGNEIK